MSMITHYTSILDKNNIPYDVICADRYGTVPDYVKGSVMAIPLNTKDCSKIKKIPHFLRYRAISQRIIKQNQYDFIIVWGENTAVLFADVLHGKNYCINIRDIDFPGRVYKEILRSVCRHAAFNTIPLDIELEELEGIKCIPIFSINTQILSQAKHRTAFRKTDEVIRISFIGKVRFIEIADEIIRRFHNDSRFQIQFFGVGSTMIEKIVKKYGADNVVWEGEFKPEDTYKYLDRTDIVDACYGDGMKNRISKYALPIKFGYAPAVHVPVMVSPNTYMEEISTSYGFGFIFRDEDTIADQLYKWYHAQNYDAFQAGCDRFREDCSNNNRKLEEILLNYL